MCAQHFLQLHFFKKQAEAVENATDRGNDVSENIGEVEGTVFDEAVVLLQRLEKELINEISDSVALDVKAKSRAYRTDKYKTSVCHVLSLSAFNLLLSCSHEAFFVVRWFAMQSSKEIASLSMTPSGCPMFQELAARLHILHDALALPLFHQAWKNLASQFDQVRKLQM